MKKILFILAALLTIGFSAKADHDQVVTFNQTWCARPCGTGPNATAKTR